MFFIIPTSLPKQLPNGVTVNAQNFQDRKVKLEDLRMNLIMNFRKLRVIYNKVIENTAMFEECPVEVSRYFEFANMTCSPLWVPKPIEFH